jgi:hypothetical protein
MRHLDGQVVDRLRRADVDVRLQVARCQTVHGGHHICRRERRAVVPRHAGTQLERPHGSIGIGAPRLGQSGNEHCSVALRAEVLEALRHDGVRTEVGHRYRVERGAGLLRCDAQIAALLDLTSRCRIRGRSGPASAGGRCAARSAAVASARRDDRAHEGGPEAQHGSANHEGASRDHTCRVAVDQICLEGASVAARSIELCVVHVLPRVASGMQGRRPASGNPNGATT